MSGVRQKELRLLAFELVVVAVGVVGIFVAAIFAAVVRIIPVAATAIASLLRWTLSPP